MEMYEKMLQLAEKSKLTAKERELIVSEAANHDIRINTLCESCYKDAAMQLAVIYKPKDVQPGAYKLREGLDVRFNGYHITADTITDDLAKRILAQGFPERYFVEMPSDEGNG